VGVKRRRLWKYPHVNVVKTVQIAKPQTEKVLVKRHKQKGTSTRGRKHSISESVEKNERSSRRYAQYECERAMPAIKQKGEERRRGGIHKISWLEGGRWKCVVEFRGGLERASSQYESQNRKEKGKMRAK